MVSKLAASRTLRARSRGWEALPSIGAASRTHKAPLAHYREILAAAPGAKGKPMTRERCPTDSRAQAAGGGAETSEAEEPRTPHCSPPVQTPAGPGCLSRGHTILPAPPSSHGEGSPAPSSLPGGFGRFPTCGKLVPSCPKPRPRPSPGGRAAFLGPPSSYTGTGLPVPRKAGLGGGALRPRVWHGGMGRWGLHHLDPLL